MTGKSMTNASAKTPCQIVVMGVSGCGKTSIGVLLSKALGIRFTDGDDLHPTANKEKMAAGIPLNDDDRWPWLDLVGLTLSMPEGAIVACSALKKSYRDRIRSVAPDAVFVHLVGSRELLMERLQNRKNHFMPPSLLESQLNTLEELQADEVGFSVDVGPSEAEVLASCLEQLAQVPGKSCEPQVL
jgi:carbohydrate kinase (thermoresistant glucokinase family)